MRLENSLKILPRAGVECRMHDLRNSLVSKLAEQGISLPTIKAISGHTTSQMVDTQISPGAQRQALAMLVVPTSSVQ